MRVSSWKTRFSRPSRLPGRGERVEVHHIRNFSAICTVGPLAVEERKVPGDAVARSANRLVVAQIDFLALHGSPKALDAHIVAPLAAPVHAGGDAAVGQRVDGIGACEFAALICVHDLGHGVAGDRLIQGFDAELGVHRDRVATRQHTPAVSL